MDTDTEPATMSVAEAGRLLGISTRSAYRAADAGQLPTIRIGRRLLVPTAKLHDLLGLRPTPDDRAPAEGPPLSGSGGEAIPGDGTPASGRRTV